MEFQDFPKMARFSRECVITEKIDGTNAQIAINDDGQIFAGSRSRWITPADDNYGFAAWVEGNRQDLLKLGPGRHFGEWWGAGIQRRYGKPYKQFSLFNVSRWKDAADRPDCCLVVPELYRGILSASVVDGQIHRLAVNGSVAAPGFMSPEGIVIFHIAGNVGFKKTLEADGMPKSAKK